MTNLKELNRAVNRALRVLNSIAVDVASSSLTERNVALDEITQALVHVDKLQRLVFASDPSLEYHFDASRAPTPAMKEVSDLVEAAERYMQQGNVAAACDALERACDLEPPPLAYEMIEKRLIGLRRSR